MAHGRANHVAVGSPQHAPSRIHAPSVDVNTGGETTVLPRNDGTAGAVGRECRIDLVVAGIANEHAGNRPLHHTRPVDSLRQDIAVAEAVVLPGDDGTAGAVLDHGGVGLVTG